MDHHNHIQELHFLSNPKTELRELYANLFLNKFALSLFNIFVAIFLIDLGFSIKDVLVFMIEFYAFWLLITLPTARLISKLGKKKVIGVSSILSLVVLFGMYLLEHYKLLLYVVPLIWATAKSFYWLPLNSHFAEHSDKHKVGKNTSVLVLAARVGAALGPVLGGYIATYFSFNTLFLVAGVVLLLSIIPLFDTKDEKDYWDVDLKKLVGVRKDFLKAFFLMGALVAVQYIFLNLFIYFKSSILDLGAINSVALVLSLASTYFIGSLSDKYDKKSVLKLGALIYGSLFFILAFTNNVSLIFLIRFLLGLVGVLLSIPLFSLVCSSISEKESLEFMSIREMMLKLGGVVGLSIFLFVPQSMMYKVAFLMIAVLSFAFITLRLEVRAKA